MHAQLTFGEYMRRLRRSRKWSLTQLAENCNISYPHLSRLENDSVVPSVESVVRLSEALDGDVKIMLELSNCLPRVILDRIRSPEESTADSLMRTAGTGGDPAEEAMRGVDHALSAPLKDMYNLEDMDAGALALAIDGLMNLERTKRASIFTLIADLSAQEGSNS